MSLVKAKEYFGSLFSLSKFSILSTSSEETLVLNKGISNPICTFFDLQLSFDLLLLKLSLLNLCCKKFSKRLTYALISIFYFFFLFFFQ